LGKIVLKQATAGWFFWCVERATATAVCLIRIERADCCVGGAVEFRGDPRSGRFVEHLTWRGVTLSDTAWEPDPREAMDSQASSPVPGAVVATGARRLEKPGDLGRRWRNRDKPSLRAKVNAAEDRSS
jgi:hypothetical protein